MSETTVLERLLLHHKAIVVWALVAVITGSWLYLLMGAGTGMSTIDMTSWQMALGLTQSMTMPIAWTPQYALVMFIMWWVMMIAMMLPSAAPMILIHAQVDRKAKPEANTGKFSGLITTAAFVFGYLTAWAAFSAVATTLQWAFESAGLLSSEMMNSTNDIFAGIILLFAGAYQLTPIKQACLRHCRGPVHFLVHSWRSGSWGALLMGLHHGVYCLGCCWGLMAILFFGGIMNLYWIIGLASLILVEKVLPLGVTMSYVTGGLLAVWGASIIFYAGT
jgi:predicted metal-binding membrane protein